MGELAMGVDETVLKLQAENERLKQKLEETEKPKPKKTQVVTVRMTDDLHRTAKSAAHLSQVSLNDFCTQAIERAILLVTRPQEESAGASVDRAASPEI